MNVVRFFFCLILIFDLLTYSPVWAKPENPSTFRVNGKIIHPRLISLFVGQDYLDVPPLLLGRDQRARLVSMDVTDPQVGPHETIKMNSDGLGFKQYEIEVHSDGTETKKFSGYFDYKVLGMLNRDIYAVTTKVNGGGSGTFHTLLFFRLEEKSLLSPSGVEEKRLILSLAGSKFVGDRYKGKIGLSRNTVRVGPYVAPWGEKFPGYVIKFQDGHLKYIKHGF